MGPGPANTTDTISSYLVPSIGAVAGTFASSRNRLFPGNFLAVTVLAENILGDGLRDVLDPRTPSRSDSDRGHPTPF
jgi:hypothetical protein